MKAPASRLAIVCAVAFLVAVAIVDFYLRGIQLAPLVTIPLLVIAYYGSLRLALALAVASAIFFGYIDYSPISGSRIGVDSFLVDGAVLALSLGAAVLVADLLQKQSRREDRLQHDLVRSQAIALTDSLTGLMNRRGFEQTLASVAPEIRGGSRGFAVLFLDLNSFKEINDLYGHDVGDQVLKSAAKRISRAVRADDVVARLGGDEFTILCDKIRSAEGARRIAHDIRASFDDPIVYNDRSVALTASIGIAVAPEDGTDVGGLMQLADRRMYEDKADR
jgi:diguanylate cyclase (GGDEF)-like protein